MSYFKKNFFQKAQDTRSASEIAADTVASVVGSWQFLIIQTSIIIFWIVANTVGVGLPKWDPYPFIFLNLTLSFQAAYTAPIIMMSQNRQSKVDRSEAELDYEINKLAKQEIDEIQTQLEEIKQILQKQK